MIILIPKGSRPKSSESQRFRGRLLTTDRGETQQQQYSMSLVNFYKNNDINDNDKEGGFGDDEDNINIYSL